MPSEYKKTTNQRTTRTYEGAYMSQREASLLNAARQPLERGGSPPRYSDVALLLIRCVKSIFSRLCHLAVTRRVGSICHLSTGASLMMIYL